MKAGNDNWGAMSADQQKKFADAFNSGDAVFKTGDAHMKAGEDRRVLAVGRMTEANAAYEQLQYKYAAECYSNWGTPQGSYQHYLARTSDYGSAKTCFNQASTDFGIAYNQTQPPQE